MHNFTQPTMLDINSIVIVAIAALAPTIAALAAFWQGIANGKKATEIHALANSTYSDVTKQLAVANERISGLEQQLAQQLKRMNGAAEK